MPENDILGDALGVGVEVEVEKSAYHLQQPINEEQVNQGSLINLR
ncbi:hypothetical protein [Vibrio lentus]|nr:hypothetical protein [Vibrio lentus]